MEIMLLAIGIILLDIVALRWGADSRDGINSSEWLKRLQYHF